MPFYQSCDRLTELGQQILQTTWRKFPSLSPEQIALTWLVYDNPVVVNTDGALSPEAFWEHPIRGFQYRGDVRLYPASVVKLFYLVAIHEWLEGRMLQDSTELERAIQDMIVESSNDATSYIIDSLTGTTSGPELPPEPLQTWSHQRNIINRYYHSLGWEELTSINVNQKPWSDGPYGRERQFLGANYENRNMLTTNAIARLFHSIMGGVAVSRERCQSMIRLLNRSLEPADLQEFDEENQVTGFLGEVLPEDSQLWSKAGWTSRARHDAAYIEVPGQQPYLLVVFTEGEANAQNRAILPFISEQILGAIAKI
ncbi:serine hydrolase [Picosynechococcus sp. PCC 7003]|uniref:serine hydrolase n=1 Tax=Picosynechococcus sp. PCC 7003 TaxID=374981 RepID=UPI000810AFFA|nr:serine hydrolase [Picosynechococcus sp. PCC 7003]ANV84695.1 serine hydrolase [Picosynechococcus sp. PCC 7003]